MQYYELIRQSHIIDEEFMRKVAWNIKSKKFFKEFNSINILS